MKLFLLYNTIKSEPDIYDYYIKEGKTQEQASQRVAIGVGRLLKSVLEKDGREFETVGKDTGTRYKFVR